MLTIDGSYGEGGGQILRTALALSAITGQPVRIENIRARRRNPGLQAQHLTGVLAIAEICGARLQGAELGSRELVFVPRREPQAGAYQFDVAKARKGGSAGAVTLILQTVLIPLALARGVSRLVLKGGTHVAWSPPYHYVEHVLLPTLARMGIEAEVRIERWGWYPIGGGEVRVTIYGGSRIQGIEVTERGRIERVWGISAYSNLPEHIGERQRNRAVSILRRKGLDPRIRIVKAPSPGKGTCVFLVAESENALAGFTALGERGKRAEKVAEEAAGEFLRYLESGAALDRHLADQLILPLALAESPGAFTTCEVTRHLTTNVWVVEQFLGRRFEVQGEEGRKGYVRTV